MSPPYRVSLRVALLLVLLDGLALWPVVAADEFQASVTRGAGDSILIEWDSALGFVDTVHASDDLLDWQAVPGSSFRGVAPSRRVSFTLPLSASSPVFYRIHRIPDPGVSITEFMAVNDDTIPSSSGFGDDPDWIELYNGGAEAVTLKEFFLTDSPDDLTKWELPDVTLAAGEFLLIHATGTDQRNPLVGPLEADFRLAREGGYLALVAPGGAAILSEFFYAEQFEDVSFGLPFVTLPPVGGVDIPDHVVAQWNMDEPSGPLTDVAQAGSDAHPIEIAGMTYLQPGLVADGGSSIGFSTTTETPATANAADLGIAANPQFTAEGFFEITDAEAGEGINYIMGSRRLPTGWAVWLRDGGKLAFVFDGTGGLVGTEFFGESFVDDGQVHHFALVADREAGSTPGTGKATLYLDGLVEHVMDNIPANHMDADDGFFVGRRHNSPFGGRLDVLRFSKRALTPDEFLQPSDFTGGDGTPTNQPRGLAGFLRDPTPGAANGSLTENAGPRILSVEHSPDHGRADEDIIVTAWVAAHHAPVGEVTLNYRTMYERSQTTISMFDDGSGSDLVAGDGIYSGVIPSSSFDGGEMVRWFVRADDLEGNHSRKPEFLRPLESAEYFGTVIRDPALPPTDLPVLDWFVPDPTWYRIGSTNTREFSQGSLYYDGEFIDNLRIRTRGRTAANAIKPNLKFDFYSGGHFKVLPEAGRVEEMNLNGFHGENIWSRSFMRSVLAYSLLRENGVPTPYSFHVHVRRNGEFFGLCAMEEQVDSDFLVRHDLNARGSLYKASGNGNLLKTYPEGDWTKDQPEDADFSELRAFIDGISPVQSRADRETFLFDNVSIPVMVNYLATFAVTLNHDRIQHNYYMYRDLGRSDEWMMIPWDVDRSFSEGAQLTDPRNTNIYYGDSDHWRVASGPDVYNRLYDALFDSPRGRQMYQRRLRTLVDEWHGRRSARLKGTLTDLSTKVAVDAALDEARWANNSLAGGNRGITTSIDARRGQLERVSDLPSSRPVASEVTLLEAGTSARYHVAASDEGAAWRSREFDDDSWDLADTGLGFDSSSNPETWYAHHIGHDEATAAAIRTEMENAANPSLYLRVLFEILRPEAISALTLNLRFDDGFVAWLNGVQVASANAPATVAWNAAATETADEIPARGAGLDFELGAHLDTLVAGENILAIQVMNTDLASGDLLCLPTITAVVSENPSGVVQFGQLEYNPPSGNQDEEFIELVNPLAISIDLSGWELGGGVEHDFIPGTVLAAGDSLFLSPNVRAFRNRGSSPTGGERLFVQGNYRGHLSNAGELIELRDAAGRLVTSTTTPADLSPWQRALRVTELMFNPHPPNAAEMEAGFTDNDDFEFIELTNIGDAPLALDGVAFTDGIDYRFPNGLTMNPGSHLVVVRNLAAFQFRYGASLPVASTEYRDPADGSNNFANGGEAIKLEDPLHSTILDFRYGDSAEDGWHDEADGDGGSLEIIDPGQDPDLWDNPLGWRPSALIGGSPGT